MTDNNVSSTNCLIVDTTSFDWLFMCKLERTNDMKYRPLRYIKKPSAKTFRRNNMGFLNFVKLLFL